MRAKRKSSSHFLCKVRNQVLKNQKIEYLLKRYVFEKMEEHSDYTFLNDVYTRRKKNKSVIWTLEFYGPKDYSWGQDATCCFFNHTDRREFLGNKKTIFMLPRDWLCQYDPIIPIIIGGYSYCYLDLEKQNCSSSLAYLIRDRFRITDFDNGKPYSIGKFDEKWCITYLNLHSFYTNNFYRLDLLSFLLTKNIDFSDFDVQVKAKGLKCPVPCNESIIIQDNSQNGFGAYTLIDYYETPCFCVICRKDYRAIEVGVYLNEGGVNLYPLHLIK